MMISNCSQDFTDKETMLAYKMIVYNGDLDKMEKTHLDLTWFEEIMLKHEMKWGRTQHCWQDLAKIIVLKRHKIHSTREYFMN